jgi:hypothetical protein
MRRQAHRRRPARAKSQNSISFMAHRLTSRSGYGQSIVTRTLPLKKLTACFIVLSPVPLLHIDIVYKTTDEDLLRVHGADIHIRAAHRHEHRAAVDDNEARVVFQKAPVAFDVQAPVAGDGQLRQAAQNLAGRSNASTAVPEQPAVFSCF